MAKLIYKIAICGEIKVITGLHIGGSDSDLDIGGIDNSVIKTKDGIPYIPGSSLKGKLRDLIARSKGYPTIKDDKNETRTLFEGTKGKDYKGKEIKLTPTRLLTRDCFIVNKTVNLEDKAENVIDRSTGIANPRHIERVFPDSVFKLEMILDIYDVDRENIINLLETLKLGFKLLENDYLGGSGSRGYGKVALCFTPLSFPYQSEEPAQNVTDFKFAN